MNERKVSVPGVISTAIAILGGSGIFTLFIIAGYLEESTPGGVPEDSPILVQIGIALVAMVALIFIGIILGIVGSFQSNTKKLFSVLGTVLNLVVFLGTIAAIIIGSMME